VSDPAVMGRLLRRDPSAFPVRMAGRRSQRPFRGLLGLHSHCGPSTRRPTPGGPLFRELQRFGCPPRRLGSYRDVPTTSRTGLSPARDTAPQRGAHSNPRFGLPGVVTSAVVARPYDAVATNGCHDAFERALARTGVRAGLKTAVSCGSLPSPSASLACHASAPLKGTDSLVHAVPPVDRELVGFRG